jgi:hypothetical protein
MSLRFRSDSAGRITGLTFVQSGRTFELARRGTTPEARLPTVDEVLRLRQRDGALRQPDALRTLRLTGRVCFVHQGVEGTVEVDAASADRFVRRWDLGEFGYDASGLEGEMGWHVSTFAPSKVLRGDSLMPLRLANPLTWVGNWRDTFGTAEVARSDTLEDQKVYVIDITGQGRRIASCFVNADTGLVMRLTIPGPGTTDSVVTLEDYRDVMGTQIPFKITADHEARGRIVTTFDHADANPTLSPNAFSLAPPAP